MRALFFHCWKAEENGSHTITPEEVAEICVEIQTTETDAANCKTVSH